MKYIVLSTEKKKELQKEYGVSHVTVWSALNYITKSDLSEKIRTAALDKGGVVVAKVVVPSNFVPNCECQFIHKDNTVDQTIQTFSNGFQLKIYWREGKAELIHDSKILKSYEVEKFKEWGSLLFETQQMNDTYAE